MPAREPEVSPHVVRACCAHAFLALLGRGRGTVVARSFATAIARASEGGTIEAGEPESALAFEVDAGALPAALVRASARLACIATPARPAHALARVAAAVIVALVGA